METRAMRMMVMMEVINSKKFDVEIELMSRLKGKLKKDNNICTRQCVVMHLFKR